MLVRLGCRFNMSDPRRWPAPWVFSLLILPLGIIIGFKSTPLPFLLSQAGVSVDRIASVSSIVTLPGVLVFFWAPLVDVKLRRRTWLAIAILMTSTLGVLASYVVFAPGDAHLKWALFFGLNFHSNNSFRPSEDVVVGHNVQAVKRGIQNAKCFRLILIPVV